MLFADQQPCRFWRILLSRILDWSKLLITVNLKQTEVLGKIETVETEQLGFDTGVGSGRYCLFGLAVVVWHLFQSNMVFRVESLQCFLVRSDPVQEFSRDEVGCHETVPILQLSVFVQLFLGGFWHFRILANLHSSIVQNMDANLFVWRYFVHKFRDDIKVVFDHVAKAARISNFQKDVVYASNVQIFHMSGLQVINDPMPLHLIIDSPVSSRSQADLAFSLYNDFPIEVNSWQTSLREKDYRLFFIAEVFMFLEEIYDFLVVHI